MAQSGSKRFGIRGRLRLLRLLIRNNWQQETAYFSNVVAGTFTPLLYSLTFIFFISVLYQNIHAMAGYTKDEMLFVIFIGQASFFSYNFWGQGSEYMETYVNTGQLDYILTRPVPSLFYMTFERIRPLEAVLNFLGPLTPVWIIIDWSMLNIHLNQIVPAAIVFFCGAILFHQSQFIVSMVAFWTGRGRQAMLIVYAASSQSIPLEGLTTSLRWLFLGIVPVYISAVAASILLGKAEPWPWAGIVLTTAVIFSMIKRYLWRLALRHYSSASS